MLDVELAPVKQLSLRALSTRSPAVVDGRRLARCWLARFCAFISLMKAALERHPLGA